MDGRQHDSYECLLELFKHSQSLGSMFLMRRTEEYTCQSCSLVSRGKEEQTTEYQMPLRDVYGDSITFAELQQKSCVGNLSKRCVRCDGTNEAVGDGRLHTQCTRYEMMPESKYVVLKIEWFTYDVNAEDIVVKRKVLSRITDFEADDVSLMGEKLRVCAAVVYDSVTGDAGHYYTYVRHHGEDQWLICNDRKCTRSAKFVPGLKDVMYMILERL